MGHDVCMSMNIQQRGEKFQLRVKHNLLQKPFFFSFASRDEAHQYGTQLEAFLARGIVPQELLAPPPKGHDPTLLDVLREYGLSCPSISDTDRDLSGQLYPDVAGTRLSAVTYLWSTQFVERLKIERHLAPRTVRGKVGCLARAIDHYTALKKISLANPMRLLPQGYSIANKVERLRLEAKGLRVKKDVFRNRRLTQAEDALIQQTLTGAKRPDRERAFPVDPELSLLYAVFVDTGLRLREGYTLTKLGCNVDSGLLHVDGTKGQRGAEKPRSVPLKPVLRDRLRIWRDGLPAGEWRLFPQLWDGDKGKEALKKVTGRLSARFASLFRSAGVPAFVEHDLRHEACCRWFELRRADGAWIFSEVEIARIMGWSDLKQVLVYASLRGEDLVDRLK